ncbi:hypothetical protein N658DRAFT_473339 [Parathielavia hyrcaniae]|uniref:Uncharacterized protein n=1 Tax=Parathielavia hyrcaniae TaxID=113614 RepID=A0AAN6T1A7_9PEZI|nr:hypothetical protein N658DRAFT_473339 [Parathielavia hyrcaniae]
MEWAKIQYNKQYDTWVPWLEDLYLRYFTSDNKASYTTRENLAKTKLDNPALPPGAAALQDDTHNLVANQLGQGGLARPVGDLVSKEGVNRAERKGKDERGGYVPNPVETAETTARGLGEGVAGTGNAVVGGTVAGGQQAAGAVKGGVERAGGLFRFGGGKGEGEGKGSGNGRE